MPLPKATLPFLVGVTAGAITLGGMALGNDWVVTSKVNDLAVENAWINAQAKVCAAHAEAHLKTTKSDVSLAGYQFDARKAREDLAETFAIALPGEETAAPLVVTACAQLLNSRA